MFLLNRHEIILLRKSIGKRIPYRSRTVIEAFHYAKMGYHLEDEYEGFKNHLICNCESGFLPPLSDVERDLARLADSSI